MRKIGGRVAYSVEIKEKAIEMKLAGKSTQEIMQSLNIRNKTQVIPNGKTHRFHQGVGKQYSYGKGLEELSENDKLKLELKIAKLENDVLKKYKEVPSTLLTFITKNSTKKASPEVCPEKEHLRTTPQSNAFILR